MSLKVLFVSSEVAPYSKTGGLADVSSALPHALARLGCDVRVLTPRYGLIDAEKCHLRPLKAKEESFLDLRGHDFRIRFLSGPAATDGPRVYFLECEALFDRPGIYVDPFSNRDYLDNDYRFIALSKAVFELCRRLKWKPDIFHCNDWQSSLFGFYHMREQDAGRYSTSRSVLTIHNISYQGLFPQETLARIGGDAEQFAYPGGPLEYYGQVNFLKAGIEFADGLNTVSPTYAREIQGSHEFGCGLETVLRERSDFTGILNGIDVDIWNPATDKHLAATYSAETLDRKFENKQALCKRMGLAYSATVPLFGIISRIVGQKGFDLLVSALPEILNLPAQLVLLGSGDPHYEHVLREIARVFPDRAAVQIGYDEQLSHWIEAGADLFLMPSHYEPCGLNQMMSMHYGTVPVVRATGGLADTVGDADQDLEQGTGFSFEPYTTPALVSAARRAVHAFKDQRRWRQIQQNGMSRDFSWNHSAELYLNLYERCLKNPPHTVV